MRILALYPYVPYPMERGAYYRGFHLLKQLARAHDVDLLALTENGEGAAHRSVFAEFCHRVELVPFQHPHWPKLFVGRLLNPLPATVTHWTLPVVRQALARMLGSDRYDAVHLFDIILAQYFVRASSKLPLVADRTRIDLQYQLMQAQRMRFAWKTRLLNVENMVKLWGYERRVARRSSLQIVCGPDDHAFIRKHISRTLPLAVIPNGVDIDYFHPDAGPAETRAPHPTVVFCGAMDYNPNIDALRWYFAEIHERLRQLCPGLHVWIVGKDPGLEIKTLVDAQPNVYLTGAVPDVRPYYRRAWLQIVPLRIGGGTRLKIVESLAMGTPVVSTTVGAQGLALRHNHDILLADSAAVFAHETARALNAPALRQKLEFNGLESVRSRLSWPMLGQQLCDVYAHHFGAPPRPGDANRTPVESSTIVSRRLCDASPNQFEHPTQ
jgi:glycosyltransferase involved in cell wall biosynthesis